MMASDWGEKVALEARQWLGTPYQHQASIKHVGCDCLGLLRGVWRGLRGDEPEIMPSYAPRWNDACDDDLLNEMLLRHFTLKPCGSPMMAGDILLFKYKQHMPARHLGIVSGDDRFIHSYVGRGVVENRHSPWWKRHVSTHFKWIE